MSRSLEVEVEPFCISSGYCRNSAPSVFAAGPDRKSVVTSNPVEETPAIWTAMESCPVEAITAKDAATGETVFPEP